MMVPSGRHALCIATLYGLATHASEAFHLPQASFICRSNHHIRIIAAHPVSVRGECFNTRRQMRTFAGSGGGDENNFIRNLSKSLPSPTTIVFWGTLILFPGFFFGLLSNLFLAAIIIPVVGFVAFDVWAKTQLQEAPCPSCGAPVQGFKDGQPFQCYSCGEPLVADKEAKGKAAWVGQTVFGVDDLDGGASSTDPRDKKSGKTETNFVDVDIL